jgi:antitoxin (DNA-binding transcriptional repressor) of toxin-antitoxin stability system
MTVSIKELGQNSETLLRRVEAGERLTVVRGDRAIAEVRPVSEPRSSARPYGLAAGAFRVPDEFDAPLPDDVVRGFEAS